MNYETVNGLHLNNMICMLIVYNAVRITIDNYIYKYCPCNF